MEAIILKCSPGSRFHLGQSAMRQNETLTDTADIIHSDVLFGAFINAVAQQYPTDAAKWKSHFESGNIRFSSAFYCVELNNKIIYLLPKPINLNRIDTSNDKNLEKAHKQLKKVTFLSKGVWEQQLLPGDWLAENSKCVLPEKRAVFLKDELEGADLPFKLSEKTDTQKVKVRKESADGSLYTQTDLVMMGNEKVKIHWYFLWENTGLNEEEKKEARNLIKLMAASGIGGERSTGCGYIEKVCFEPDFSIATNDKSSWCASLSLVIPQETETEHLQSYQVLPRGGMYYGAESSGKRIKMVNTLAEGTVASKPVTGRIADLSTQDRKHWRYGMAFTIPLPKAYQLKDE